MVDLAKDSDLVEDLESALSVSRLGTLDSSDCAVFKCSLVDLTEASRAEEVILEEVVCCLYDLFACEDLG